MNKFKLTSFITLFLINIILIILSVHCSEDEEPAPNPPGGLSFIISPQIFEPSSTFQIELGDLDDDGDIDAVFSNMGENNCSVWLNDGTGYFIDSGQKLTEWGHGVGVGDLDEDGDLDLFIACASYSHKSKIYFNDGTGNFTDSGQDLGDSLLSGNGVALIDINSDHYTDVHVTYYEQPDRIYLNNGNGVFDDSGLTIPEHVTFGFLDSDSTIDIFIKEHTKGYKTMLNDGQGHFSDCWQMDDNNVVYGSVGLCDLDGDGDEDALVCNGDHTGLFPSKVLLNDGNGYFSDTGQELGITIWGKVEFGDLDSDQDIDVFVSNLGMPNQVWINNGNGLFSDSGLKLHGDGNNNTSHAPLADLDNDGDLDIFVANFVDGGNQIWFNETE